MKLPFKRVLLSGGTGYLGSHLIPMLLNEGCEPTLLIRAQSRTEHLTALGKQITLVPLEGLDLPKLFQSHKIEAVLHAACAGRHGGKQLEIVEANVELGKRLLQAAIQNQCSHFLHTDTALVGAQDFYVQTKKRFREELIKAGDSITSSNFLLQPIYGPGAQGFLNAVLEKMVVQPHGVIPLTECKQVRDLIHINDCVSAIRAIFYHLPTVKGFSETAVGTGVGHPLREMLEFAHRLIGNQAKLDFGALPPRASEPAHLVANIEKLNEFGWQPQISLQEGVRQLVEIYLTGLSHSQVKAA